jgi:hypothetical protein
MLVSARNADADTRSSCCLLLLRAAHSGGGAIPSRGSSGDRGTPRHAVLLRWGGMLSVLDLSRGAELMLADEVSLQWLF